MSSFEILFDTLLIAFVLMVFLHERIRRAVNEKLPGSQGFSILTERARRWPWIGRDGLFEMHSQLYPDSKLQLAFWIDLAIIAVLLILAATFRMIV